MARSHLRRFHVAFSVHFESRSTFENPGRHAAFCHKSKCSFFFFVVALVLVVALVAASDEKHWFKEASTSINPPLQWDGLFQSHEQGRDHDGGSREKKKKQKKKVSRLRTLQDDSRLCGSVIHSYPKRIPFSCPLLRMIYK
jgi:hypothetical protein